jgi:ATP-binding protein involved in chromosome partitioning
VALLDVGRGIAMFAQVQTPVLGIVENMAGYTCPSCGTQDAIFGEGGGARLAAAFDLPLLGRIPLVPAVRAAGDAGKPIVLADPHGTVAEAFHLLARRVLDAAAGVATAAPLGVAPA